MLELGAREAAELAFGASFDIPEPPGGAAASATTSASRAAAALRRIGHVQIDTISVVERAHHHVLWSRDRSYRPPVLDALQLSAPRRAFEYWSHAAAYLPMEDYRYCLPRMRRVEASGHEWFPHDRRIVEAVIDRIRDEGPLRSQDFDSDGKRGPWWDWKPAKAALEYLFHAGALIVLWRPGFQKLYELAERGLPPGLDIRFPDEDEMADYYLGLAAAGYGVFSRSDLAYMRKDAVGGVDAAIERAVEGGALVPVVVRPEGAEGRPWKGWAASRYLEAAGKPVRRGADARPARILSPFDNAIIDRKRAKRVYGLDYTIECYVPAAKRRFGYFALPIFYGSTPVGLIDCKADRKAKELRALRCELLGRPWAGSEGAAFRDGGATDYGLYESFYDELLAYAAFNGCESLHRD